MRRGDLLPLQRQPVGLQRRFDQRIQLAFAARPIFEDRVQASTGAGATGEREEAAARLAGIGNGQGVAVRRFHVHAGGQSGEAADAPGAVQAAIELRQLLWCGRSARSLSAGFARFQRQTGHMAVATLHQSLDGQAQAAAVEVSQVVAQLAQRLFTWEFTPMQQPGQGTAVQALIGQAAVLLRFAQIDRPPMQPEPVTGAGQRDIGQAQLLGEDFLARAL